MECAICYEPLFLEKEDIENNGKCQVFLNEDNKHCIKLVCGHVFHYNCLQISLKKLTQRSTNYKRKYGECPYCRSFNGYIPLLPSTIPLQGVHKEYREFEQCVKVKDYDSLQKYLNINFCCAILKSGINKGTQCQKPKGKSGFCPKHERFYGNLIKSDNTQSGDPVH